MTFQVHIKIGKWYKDDWDPAFVRNYHRDSTVELWIARENQPSQLVYSLTDYDLANSDDGLNPANPFARYGKIWLLPYDTGRHNTVTYADTYTWYDELIVSRRRIADPSVATPNPPDSTTVSGANVSWRSNSNGTESQFKVERCTGFRYDCDYSQAFTQIGIVNTGVTNFTDLTAAAATPYTYRVRATNSSGDSAYTNGQDNTPGVPVDLIATTGSNQVNLSWTDTSESEQGFGIERCAGTLTAASGQASGSCFGSSAVFAPVGQVGPASGIGSRVSFTDTTATGGSTYTYRVRSFNAAGSRKAWDTDNTAYSNSQQAVGTALPPPPPPVCNAPNTMVNGVCTPPTPPPPTCNPPNTIVNGVCTPPLPPPPPTCNPPNTLVNGVCTPPTPPPPVCNPPNTIVNGVCTPPTPPPGGFAGLPAGIGWHELAGTALSTSSYAVCPANNFGSDFYLFRDRCSGIYAFSGSFPDPINNRLILWGGGHGDYSGNELYAINLTANPVTRTRLSNPTVPTVCWPTNCTPRNPNVEEIPTYPINTITRDSAGVVTITTATWPMNFTVGTKVRVSWVGLGFDAAVSEQDPGAGPNSGITVTAVSGDKKTITLTYDNPVMNSPLTASAPSSSSAQVDEWSNTVYTGAPNARHTYNSMVFDPNLNKMVFCGGSLAAMGFLGTGCYSLDNITSMTGDFSTNNPQWTRHFLTPTPSGAYPARSDMPCMDYDPNSKLHIYYDEFDLHAIDFGQNKSVRLTQSANLSAYHMTCVVDPNLHMLYMMGEYNGAFIKAVDISSCAGGISSCAQNLTFQDWTGASSGCSSLATGVAPGLAYDPVGRQVVGIPGGTQSNSVMGSAVYYTAVPDSAAKKFTCTAVTAPGNVPPAASANGIYGRFRYFPGPDVFMLDYAPNQNVWFLRIR
jgi:hypothetical protein